MSKKISNKQLSIDQSILDILRYKSVFNAAASYYQILTLMPYSKTLRLANFDKALEKLVRRRKIRKTETGQYYIPTGKSEAPAPWQKNYKKSLRLLKKFQPILNRLAKISWIKMIGITGSVANYNADKSADIDLFVIVRKNRVWLSRLFLVGIAKLLNVYPQVDKQPGKICPNIIIDTTDMRWREQNAYTAHEIATLQPVVDRDQTYLAFMHSNKWAKEYHPNLGAWDIQSQPREETRGSRIIDALEDLAWKLQYKHMRAKITTETVSKNHAHFNKFDHSDAILGKLNSTS